jgi:hypothetical protein
MPGKNHGVVIASKIFTMEYAENHGVIGIQTFPTP